MISKRALVIRYGALGDIIVSTPLVRYLHEQGWEIYYAPSEEGAQILQHSPRIAKLIPHVRDSVPNHLLDEHWKKQKKEYDIDRIFNLTESIEVQIVCHPSQPIYMMPKEERLKRCSKDEYEYSFKYVHLNPKGVDLSPELHFTKDEEKDMEKWMGKYKNNFKIYHPVSGSGLNKIYPYWQYIMDDIFKVHKDIVLITVGGELDELIDSSYALSSPYVVPMSGKWSVRQSMLASKYCDLVIGTDTGMMHAAGAWDVTKILLFGHNDANTVSRHFKGRTIPIQSTVNCSPCHKLIYNSQILCPRDVAIGCGCLCMTGFKDIHGKFYGIEPALVRRTILEQIKEIKSGTVRRDKKTV